MARLRNVDRYFVRAQQIDFPFATKTVAGPLETFTEAAEAIPDLKPKHPGCTLTPYRKSVPIAEAHPK